MNRAKNYRDTAIFVEEVKILEIQRFAQNRNFHFRGTGPFLSRVDPKFFCAVQQLPIFAGGTLHYL